MTYLETTTLIKRRAIRSTEHWPLQAAFAADGSTMEKKA